MKYHVNFDIEFRKNPYPGIYIAFEGIDGSGPGFILLLRE